MKSRQDDDIHLRYAELERELAKRDREIEIEAALERVRTVAMGMRAAGDLLNICKILFKELTALGFGELRNAMINIINSENGSFLNYDFNGTGASVTAFEYNSHPVMERQVEMTRSAGDAFFEHVLTGDDLADFKAFRVKNGELPDPRLENVTALYYYFYSIGVGSLGISVFSSLTDENLQVLKRFRNVFDLAYRRYADIQLAESQAREAQIELSLERVRRVAMGMRKAEDLLSICRVLFAELQLLNFSDLRNAIIHTYLHENYLIDYDYSDFTQGHINHIPYSDNPIAEKYAKDIRKNKDAFAELIITGSQLKKWKAFMDANNEVLDERLGNAKSLYYYIYAVGDASIGISTFSPIQADKLDVLKRFRNVFDLAYGRFVDINRAEAQAREAQIEASLERVRSRSIGMQNSDELKEVIRIVFDQFVHLNIGIDHAGFVVDYQPNGDWHFWIADHIGSPNKLTIANFDSVWNRDFDNAKKNNIDFFTTSLDFKAKNKFYRDMFVHFPEMPQEYRDNIFSKAGLAVSTVLMESVALYIENFSGTPYTDEENSILMRFGKVFQQTYTRFLDLQKAEAQTREAQIETALEKVRSRSLAMHKTDELQDVVSVVFKQLQELGISVDGVSICTFTEKSKDIIFWTAVNEQLYSAPIYFPYFEHPVPADFWKAKEEGLDFYAKAYTVDEKNSLWNYNFKNTGFKNLPEERKKMILESPGYTFAAAWAKNSAIAVNNFAGKLFSQSDVELLKRFTRAFEQAYIRFLDLQKAEAQSREAQIELSLERVRAKTMAMHNSNDVGDTVATMFDELVKLGVEKTVRCGISVIDESQEMEVWRASYDADGKVDMVIGRIDMTIHSLLKGVYQAWKNKKTAFAYDLTGEDLKDYYRAINNSQNYPAQFEIGSLESKQFHNTFFFPEGAIFVFSLQQLSEDAIKLFKRFAGVFGLTYRRYLDLQKAEKQAREAQIQLALERVRARTMAMQHSDELSEVVFILFTQFKELGENPDQATIGIINEKDWVIEYWVTMYGNQNNKVYKFSIDEPNVTHRIYKGWKVHKKSLAIDLSGKELCDFANYRESMGGAKFNKDEKRRIINVAFFSKGLINVQSTELRSEESIRLLERFAGVFDGTYTRFLDLKQAEEQAKESKIQLALERVRARTMAMQNSNELKDIVKVVFERLQELNFAIDGAAFIATPGDADKEINIWVGDDFSEYPSCFRTPHYDTPVIADLVGAIRSELDFFSRTYSFEEKNAWFNYAFQHTDFKNLSGDLKKLILAQEYLTQCFAFTKNSAVGIHFHDQRSLSENEIDMLKRFSKVFEQSYTRFLDLQKAEEQARESQIQLGLERVRAAAMAMHDSNDVGNATALVFSELYKLGITTLRCGVCIVDGATQQMEVWSASSSQEGGVNRGAGKLDMTAHPLWIKLLNAWKQKISSFTYELVGRELTDYYKAISNAPDYHAPDSKALKTTPDNTGSAKQYCNCFLFNEGCVFAFTKTPFSPETSQVLEKFTAVFGLTYRRYLDLQKAEAQAREAQVEAALERVRSRTLAMQKSDELADTASELFRQMISLDIEPNRLYIGIIREENTEIEFWITDEDGTKVSNMFTGNAVDNPSIKKMYTGWKAHKKSIVIDMKGNELAEYFHYLGDILHVPFKGGLVQKRRVQYISFFSNGFIGMASPDEQPQATVSLLDRFAYVFNLTYARFNDLKIAENHARQAEQDLIEIKAARLRAEDALGELRSAQKQLIQSEKMASLGELTAGIAHEIQNPLNFVNNFSEVNQEMIDELTEELKAGNIEDALAIAADIKQNEEKISHHGKRADGIVKGMLQHSRTGGGEKQPTDLNALADEYLRLSYHGLRAKDKNFNAEMATHFDPDLPKINVIPQDIGRVMLNLFNNAFYAVNQKKQMGIADYKAEVTVTTLKEKGHAVIKVKDNGVGMPDSIKEKIMQPFFTTKPTGEGTGLGLSLTYDMVVKGHGGTIQVNSVEGQGSDFIIQLTIS